MSDLSLSLTVLDTRHDDVQELVDALRHKLGLRGDIVSEAGRQRTIELFGEALSPEQVVERICDDVARDGLSAVLD